MTPERLTCKVLYLCAGPKHEADMEVFLLRVGKALGIVVSVECVDLHRGGP